MAQVNPNIYWASYTRPDARGQSAARLVRYLTRRPDEKERPGRGSEWSSLPNSQVFGNPEAFKEAANRRRRRRLHRHERNGTDIEQDHSPKNVSYVHVVISPQSREEFRDEDFEALIDPWITEKRGRPCAYMAAIHYDDPEGPKLHLAVARDRIQKTRELPALKERTKEIIKEREEMIERSRACPEPERQAQHDLEDAGREEEAQSAQAHVQASRAKLREEETAARLKRLQELLRQAESRERASGGHDTGRQGRGGEEIRSLTEQIKALREQVADQGKDRGRDPDRERDL